MSSLAKRRLGRTELHVTALGLGCYQFTGEFGVPQREAAAILDLAAASGINLVDTAAMYGFGESEELLGRAFQRHPQWRPHISAKVGWLDRTVVRNAGDAAYRDEDALLRAIHHSLWLLRQERIDIFMIHEPDWAQWGFNYVTGECPALRVLERLKREQVIGAIGIGGWNCDVIADLLETGRIDVALVAGGLSLVQQPIRSRVLPAAKKHDVGIILGGAMGQGGLVVKDRPAIAAKIAAGDRIDYHRRVLQIYDLSDDLQIALPELAVRYVLSQPEIHTHIAGARESAHLRANLAAVQAGPLPADVVEKIEAIQVTTEVCTNR